MTEGRERQREEGGHKRGGRMHDGGEKGGRREEREGNKIQE